MFSKFIAEVIFCLFLMALTLAPNFPILVLCLFGAGVALGCDYPTAHIVISERIPTRARGRLVLTAFAFQAVGVFVGTGIGFVILFENPHIAAQRWMYGIAIIPAIFVIFGPFFVTESPIWLVSRNRLAEAEYETLRLLKRQPEYPKEVKVKNPARGKRSPPTTTASFSKGRT